MSREKARVKMQMKGWYVDTSQSQHVASGYDLSMSRQMLRSPGIEGRV